MIHLHQLPKLAGKEYSCSPFCLKMELYLKVMNIGYENSFSLELNKSPTGKLPFIEEAGRKFADSNLIITKLEKENGKFINHHLSSPQRAMSEAFIRLCEDSMYWSLIYARWIDTDNSSWKQEFTDAVDLPKMMLSIIYLVAKRNVSRQLKFQGVAVLTKSEIYQKLEKDIKAIADFLDGKECFFNNEISLVDIVVYSFLAMISNGSCGNKALSIYDRYPSLNIFTCSVSNKYSMKLG